VLFFEPAFILLDVHTFLVLSPPLHSAPASIHQDSLFIGAIVPDLSLTRLRFAFISRRLACVPCSPYQFYYQTLLAPPHASPLFSPLSPPSFSHKSCPCPSVLHEHPPPLFHPCSWSNPQAAHPNSRTVFSPVYRLFPQLAFFSLVYGRSKQGPAQVATSAPVAFPFR